MGDLESTLWSLTSGGITAPSGFKASGIRAGLKSSDNLDLALILAPHHALCAGTFTQSIVRAKCIDLCKERLLFLDGKVRAILINSGQANACTGVRGMEDSLIATKAVAQKLGILESEVLICSTGVIGEAIPMENLLKAVNPLVDSLSSEGSSNAAQAILTTDLRTKEIAIQANLGHQLVRVGGIAKGSGMIHPDMATMLAFLTCDVQVPKEIWDGMIKRIVDSSFNAITVDGDTSTNDSFLAFSAGNAIEKNFYHELEIGLNLVATFLAKSIVSDGEGANCLFEVKVKGARNFQDAQLIARTISSSALVKTAVHGCDPNWGRVLAAAGRAGIEFDLEDVSLWIGPFQIMQHGLPVDFDRHLVVDYMQKIVRLENPKNDILSFSLLIGSGAFDAVSWGCDLSSEYIHINADYTT